MKSETYARLVSMGVGRSRPGLFADRTGSIMTTNHHAALIYTMVLMAAADRDMTDAEMTSIGDMVAHLPVFRDYDRSKIAATAAGCVDLLNQENGLDKVLHEIKKALPE